ncbi:MAG: elongation factor Ts [Clostridia bacterium]|nr:elongation factor Ts [Clostridia bacterium]
MAFTAADVKALREKTGVGMMDCKKALTETDGDMDKAIDYLRERGLAAAQKKSGRIAAEGAVVVYSANGVTAMVEVNAETDFVAKNEKFINFANTCAQVVAEQNPADVDALMASTPAGSDMDVTALLHELILQIGENMKVRRFTRYEGETVTYIHGGGAVGVIVAFDVNAAVAAKPEFTAMGKNLAMQIAAMNPEYLSESDISAEESAKMKSFTVDSALNKPDSLPIPILNALIAEAIDGKKWSDDDIAIYQGLDAKQKKNFVNFISKEALSILAEIAVSKKEEISENKIFGGLVQGRIAKQVKEICLLQQDFVRSDLFDGNVDGYVKSVAKDLGDDIKVASFIRFEKGEGLEKRNDNFADEVASMM